MTHSRRLKVLLIAEQCNPEGASVPLVAWNFFDEISHLVDATLVTHERNQVEIERHRGSRKIIYIRESALTKVYFKIAMQLLSFAFRGKVNWPLIHLLTFPVYMEFDQAVYQKFKQDVLKGEYDIVHALNPTIPRFPVKIAQICNKVPFILGPVNGGIPFPKSFQDKARQEFAYLNFLRAVGRLLIPGYAATYKKAKKVLVGSTFTLDMLKQSFKLPDSRITLFYENGIPANFLVDKKERHSEKINLLFVGRLVPYKCADLIIAAIAKLDANIQEKLSLTIVGDGPERGKLESVIQASNLEQSVHLTGWVDHKQTLEYYQKSDIFCFPSIREFGGAVVLEAMANGLPCIVVNHGGIGEYVTDETGFRIEPVSAEYLIQELTDKIRLLVEDEQLRSNMAQKSIERAKEFEWSQKAVKIVEMYDKLVFESQDSSQGSSSRFPVSAMSEA